MLPEPSLWSFIADAGPVVKVVLLILFLTSILSWTIIIQRSLLFKRCLNAIKLFEQRFWSGVDLNTLYEQISDQPNPPEGLSAIFHAGFKEFQRLSQLSGIQVDAIIEGTQRSLRIAYNQELERLQQHLTFLATVGSTSPYIGLFGTVWGIMTAFRGLGAVQQATIAMVAPGISEALIATAFGLFAAIPAVIAYNRLSTQLDQLSQHYEVFQDELLAILNRQTHHRKSTRKHEQPNHEPLNLVS